jgi:adenosylhomocysteine nucleosidase
LNKNLTAQLPEAAKHLALCPLRPELNALIEGFKALGLEVTPTADAFYSLPELALCVGLGGHGKARYSAQASKVLASNPQIENLFCCGTSGGLSRDLKPLDIVIGKTTVEHDFHSKFIKAERQPTFETSFAQELNELAVLEQTSYVVHIGGIASGNEDVVTRQRASEIHFKTQCLAVAGEGAGGAYAAACNSVNYLEIRVVSDICDENVVSQFQQNLSPGMKNCAEALLNILQLLGRSRKP